MEELHLPKPSSNLPINNLTSVFNNNTTSYKFYWLLAILNEIKASAHDVLDIDDIVIEMICAAWHPIVRFRLSFGLQDQFAKSIGEIQQHFKHPFNIGKEELSADLKKNKEHRIVRKTINNIARYVPYRFLSPWFSNDLRGIVDSKKNNLIGFLSQREAGASSACLYQIIDSRKLRLSREWRSYLQQHLRILTDFSLWGLLNYLEKNNPNVPNIAQKLYAPMERDLKMGRKFWEIYFGIKGTVPCIYSGAILYKEEFVIDHFLPWSFVGHDQMWNLTPTIREINSSKGDNLPSMIYLEKMSSLQFDAFRLVSGIKEARRLLEDYSNLFKLDYRRILTLNEKDFKSELNENLSPLMQIAMNMGFASDWRSHKTNS